jgi:DNA-directed RNA polymerase specialized sigma24 family protein
MRDNIFKKGPKVKRQKEQELLVLELSEIKEIADILFGRLEKMIEELKNLDALATERIEVLKGLLERAESISSTSGSSTRRREIVTLCKRGLKIDEIAHILDMPSGEVELILNLNAKRH